MSTNYFSGRYLRVFAQSAAAAVSLALYTRKTLNHVPRSIVIVQPAQLGDMVCTTPVFRAIKKQFADTKVIVVGSNANEAMLAGNSDVDQYIALDQKNPEEAARMLRAAHPDAGVLAVPSLDGLVVLAYARVPFIVAPYLVGGRGPAETTLYKLLRVFVVAVSHTFGKYAASEYLRLLRPLGIHETDTTKHLVYSASAHEMSRAVLQKGGIDPDGGYVCIAPGAGNKIKQWPPERFGAVAEYVWSTYKLPVVIMGTGNDAEEVAQMRTQISETVRFVDACGTFSLDETKAIIAHARLVIAADTMAIYIAEAFNVPLIDIVGPIDEREQPPTGPNRIIIVPPGERIPQMHVLNARIYDAVEVRRQAMATTVDQVTRAVDTVLT